MHSFYELEINDLFQMKVILVRTCTLAFTFLDSYSKGKHRQVALSDQKKFFSFYYDLTFEI